MPVYSTPAPSKEDYAQHFVLRGPQVGPLCDFSITPNGVHLLLATDNSIAVVDTRIGSVQVVINTGPTSRLTTATWLSDDSSIVGCHDGHLFVARFQPATMFGSPSVTIGYAFQDLNLPVRHLCYNRNSELLAVGYERGVSIWRRMPTTWRIVDRFSVPVQVGISGIRTMQFVGDSNQMLFVGGGFGHAVWSGRDQVVFFTANTLVCRIGSSAVSADGKFLVVGALNQRVHVWPVTSDGLSSGGIYELQSGAEYHRMNPYIPVAMTDSGLVVAGSRVGELAFVQTNGAHAFNMYFERNLSTVGLLSHHDRLYVAFMGPLGYVIVVAYSRTRGALQVFERLRNAFTPGGTHSVINIDIHQLPRMSLRNLPRRTGRTDFTMVYPGRGYDYITLAFYVLVSFAICHGLFYLITHCEFYIGIMMFYHTTGLRLCLYDAYHDLACLATRLPKS
ncbi:hypothetical protein RSAG8_13143, partial [Rhizoctonia solani AG-8 WAC10335]